VIDSLLLKTNHLVDSVITLEEARGFLSVVPQDTNMDCSVGICHAHSVLHVDEFADVQEVKKGPFMDFEVKKDMRIAPLCRVLDLDVTSMAQHLDEHLASQVN